MFKRPTTRAKAKANQVPKAKERTKAKANLVTTMGCPADYPEDTVLLKQENRYASHLTSRDVPRLRLEALAIKELTFAVNVNLLIIPLLRARSATETYKSLHE